MKFRVIGLDRDNGIARTLVVDADSAEAAEQRAFDSAMMVERVEVEPSRPNGRRIAPALLFVVGCLVGLLIPVDIWNALPRQEHEIAGAGLPDATTSETDRTPASPVQQEPGTAQPVARLSQLTTSSRFVGYFDTVSPDEIAELLRTKLHLTVEQRGEDQLLAHDLERDLWIRLEWDDNRLHSGALQIPRWTNEQAIYESMEIGPYISHLFGVSWSVVALVVNSAERQSDGHEAVLDFGTMTNCYVNSDQLQISFDIRRE